MKKLFLSIALLLTVAGANAITYDKQCFKASYIAFGEEYLNKPWATLPVSEFVRFKKEGNRVGYEKICFERRRQLAALVMAEIQERKGRFMTDIINGMEVMMEEPWWGIPAHYGSPVPNHNDQTVDLFNAESAAMMAWAAHSLKKEMDDFSPALYKKVEREIEHRILKPALGTRYWWKTAGMNWNPWICSNWLTCVKLFEKDAERRQKAVTEIEGCLKAFIDAYPKDGGCDEGTGYWDRAAASLFEGLYLLQTMKEEVRVTILDYEKEKVARMGAYIADMYIGNDYCVNFADAHGNKSVAELNVLYPFALYLNNEAMRGYAAHIAATTGFWNNPAALYRRSGNFPTLGRELLFLQNIDRLAEEKATEPKNEAWYENLQIKTMRAGEWFVAFKGGHNDESHNHNDVGSFVAYAEGKPLLIDVGVGEYTSKTFSKDRYSIWTMQSDYHNLPIINGVPQKNGKNYRAKVVSLGRRSMTLDIAGAYPEEAMVNAWQRTVALDNKGVTVTERFDLQERRQTSKLVYVTPVVPDVSTPGIVRLGTHTISYPSSITVVAEPLAPLADPIIRNLWGTSLHRLVFEVRDKNLKNTLVLKIK